VAPGCFDTAKGDGLAMMQRKNPLPPGRYWQDIFEDQWSAFDAWLTQNADKVHVEENETHIPEGDEKGGNITGIAAGAKARHFYIFTVLSPVMWDQKHWGFPTVAGPAVKSSEDTVQRPELPRDLTDQLPSARDIAKDVTHAIITVAVVAAAAAVLMSMMKHKT